MTVHQTVARIVVVTESGILQQMIVYVLSMVILRLVSVTSTARRAIHRVNHAMDHHLKIAFHAIQILPIYVSIHQQMNVFQLLRE
jgi:hypothetical protein